MAARSFLEVPIQDVARSPLAEGQTLPGLCVFGLLAVVKRKPEGADAWNNFDKAAKAKGSVGVALLESEGVALMRVKVVGKHKARHAVAPEHAPLLLSVVCGIQALPALEGTDLLEMLVARGVDRACAKGLLAEQVQKLQQRPEDVAALTRASQVFGTQLGAVRHMRVPQRGRDGTVFVMSAIDLVMAARGCEYRAAQMIVFRIFKDYYSVDLEAENPVNKQVYRVRFPGSAGGNSSLALDVQGACELLCVIPGSDFGAAVRRRAVDALLRVEGGDESLIDRIRANRKFQEYLAQHDPSHPLRAVGEEAERRQTEAATLAKVPERCRATPVAAPELVVDVLKTTTTHVAARPGQKRVRHSMLSDDASPPGCMFGDVVKSKSPASSPAQLKDFTRLAYAVFLKLVAAEEDRDIGEICSELKDSSFGLKAVVPDKWRHLAEASAVQVQAPPSSAVPAGDVERAPATSLEGPPVCKKRREAFVAEDEHGAAKDAANAMWIGRLQRGGKVFFLDSWESREGLRLRTSSALLRAGHLAENLSSANPDGAICKQRRLMGVAAHEGDWAVLPPSQSFDGIYLDLCSGSEAYVRVQLELATARAAGGCVLAWTLTERDFNGEPLLLRALGIAEFLVDLGWEPAMQRQRASTLLHRSGGSRQQVLTQFWAKT